MFIDRSTVVHFDSFGIEYISQDVLNKINNNSITHNIFIIQSNDSIIFGFYCVAFKEYMIAGKNLLNYANLFSPNSSKHNGNIKCKYFKDKYVKRKCKPWL